MQFYRNPSACQTLATENLLQMFYQKNRQKGSQIQWQQGRGGGGGSRPLSDKFLGALKSKGGNKICNCRREILYKKVQLVNKFKDSCNSGIFIAIQVSNSFGV